MRYAGRVASGERRRIELLTGGVGPDGALAYDDDVAVVAGDVVASTDMLVEGVDFRLTTFSPEDIGHKALAVNLSDLAAAGAEPVGYLQALALPATIDDPWLERYAEGTRSFGVPLLGGDLSATPGALTLAITVFGRAQRLLRRRLTQPGDILLVSGPLGAAAAGFVALEQGLAGYPALVAAQRRPTPRLALGQWLARRPEVRGAMDLSDGLAADLPRFLGHGQGAELDALPVHPDADCLARALGKPTTDWAVRGGEDFELLMACPPASVTLLCQDAAAAGFILIPIGRVTGDGRLPSLGSGFDHFG